MRVTTIDHRNYYFYASAMESILFINNNKFHGNFDAKQTGGWELNAIPKAYNSAAINYLINTFI